jgi:hypothetical protein
MKTCAIIATLAVVAYAGAASARVSDFSPPSGSGAGIAGPAYAAVDDAGRFTNTQNDHPVVFGGISLAPDTHVGLKVGDLAPMQAPLSFAPAARGNASPFGIEPDSRVAALPESATWLLLMLGVGMIGAGLRLERRKSSVLPVA